MHHCPFWEEIFPDIKTYSSIAALAFCAGMSKLMLKPASWDLGMLFGQFAVERSPAEHWETKTAPDPGAPLLQITVKIIHLKVKGA